MRYRHNDHLYSGIFLYLLMLYNYIVRLKYMLEYNVVAFFIMSTIMIVFGIIITKILLNKKVDIKTKTLYMGIIGFIIILILIVFFYLVPKDL